MITTFYFFLLRSTTTSTLWILKYCCWYGGCMGIYPGEEYSEPLFLRWLWTSQSARCQPPDKARSCRIINGFAWLVREMTYTLIHCLGTFDVLCRSNTSGSCGVYNCDAYSLDHSSFKSRFSLHPPLQIDLTQSLSTIHLLLLRPPCSGRSPSH
jgi:hypothetical protein